ncbi:hypothetical protein [Methanobrevibacter sp.]|uniref:hypothetical protein n=1 Tax=Methanobrevibacter sp. TaxID=66852 RepID=UPI0038901145
MTKLDVQAVLSHKEDFTYFPGYVPSPLLNMAKVTTRIRREFLKNQGLTDEVAEVMWNVKIESIKHKGSRKFWISHFKSFIEDNPQFEDILIEA